MIYLDTSATVKRVAAEQDSTALIDWLNDRPDENLATSASVAATLLPAGLHTFDAVHLATADTDRRGLTVLRADEVTCRRAPAARRRGVARPADRLPARRRGRRLEPRSGRSAPHEAIPWGVRDGTQAGMRHRSYRRKTAHD